MGSKQYFNEVANQWDQIREGYFDENVRQKTLRVADVSAGHSAADIGAGTGFISELLLESGLLVYAIDQSEEMIKQLQAKFGKNQQFEGRVGEADDLPLPDAAVDYVFANMYLHHVERPKTAIREMVRILKPGGKLVITDLDEHNFEFLVTEQHDRWMGFKRGDLAKWYELAGLSGIRIDSLEESCCADSECGCDSAEVSIFIASGVKPTAASKEDIKKQQESAEGLKEIVRERYGSIAAQSAVSCGCGCCPPENNAGMSKEYSRLEGYNPEADMGLGCGIPTQFANISPGETVVDLGSGAGNDVFVARQLVGETGHVFGIDMTLQMVQRANDNLKKFGYQNVEFRLAEIEDLPLEDGTVDVVISNCVLNLVPDKKRAFREIYRILKTGGRVSISDIVTEEKLPDEIRNSPDLYADCVGGAVPEKEYLQIMKAAGFKNIQIQASRSSELPVLPNGHDMKKNSIRSITVCAEK